MIKIFIFVILLKWHGMSRFYALIAQLAEHIHGKDEVISSILIEGSYDLRNLVFRLYAAQFIVKMGISPVFREVYYGKQKASCGTYCSSVY